MPMMMTAAGTVPAARVFVMGVGVAGLQAIATARRLGAVVTATDVRPATKEQVESLGAKFLAVEDEEFKNAQTAGGYAKPMSAEYQAKQAALVAEHIKKQDIVITTALIPGRPAPKLVSAAMVASMRPGSVLVDLAVERGGNVEGAKAGQVADVNGVKIVGHTNVAGEIAASASALYARNLYAFVETHDRQAGQGARGQLGRRTGQGHQAHARRQGRAPGVLRRREASMNETLTPDQAAQAAEGARQAAQMATTRPTPRPPPLRRRRLRRPARRCGGRRGPCGHRRRDRSLRLPPRDLRAGDLRRLLRRLVGDAGAAYAADVGHQRHLVGHRRRRAAGRLGQPRRRRCRAVTGGRAPSGSSR